MVAGMLQHSRSGCGRCPTGRPALHTQWPHWTAATQHSSSTGSSVVPCRRHCTSLPHRHQALAGSAGNLPSQPAFTAVPQQPPILPATPSKPKTPLQQQILNGILGIGNVPYSSYVPEPATFLHKVDARIKQLWLVVLYFMIARASIPLRLGIAGLVALISMLALPQRLWTSQLTRLAGLCGFLFVMAALGADGVPLVLQPRDVPAVMEGLPDIPATGYNYVILKVFFITVTHRSINLAVTGAALTFCALQAASLILCTTPGEEMALALRWWLQPLRLIGVPVQEFALTLLLSLRFMSLVFEEVRNLCLGLAARGVDWVAQGGRGSLAMAGRLCVRLFANLFHRSENIAQAMMVRGFQGPEQQKLYMMHVNQTSYVANTLAVLLLAGLMAAVAHFK